MRYPILWADNWWTDDDDLFYFIFYKYVDFRTKRWYGTMKKISSLDSFLMFLDLPPHGTDWSYLFVKSSLKVCYSCFFCTFIYTIDCSIGNCLLIDDCWWLLDRSDTQRDAHDTTCHNGYTCQKVILTASTVIIGFINITQKIYIQYNKDNNSKLDMNNLLILPAVFKSLLILSLI